MQGLDGPPREILTEGEALLFVYQALSLNSQKLAAVDRSETTLYFPFDPRTREFSLASQKGFSRAGFVERRVDDARDVYDPVAIVDVDKINEYETAGKFAIAFFGSGALAKARLSWIPAEVSQSHLRIWHAPNTGYYTSMQEEIAFPPNFIFMLSTQSIMLAIPRVLRRAARLGDSSYVEFVRAWADVNRHFLTDFEEQFELHRSATRDDSAGQNLSFNAARRGGQRRNL